MLWQGLQLSKGHRVLSLIKDGKTGEGTAEIGMPWTTEEFVQQALQCDHPFDRRVRVPPAVAKAMAYIAREGPVGIKEKRERTIRYWEKRRSELEAGEKVLKQRLHPDVRSVVGEKNVLLFKEMLEYIRYDDLAVVELLTTGIPIVGQLERTGIWPPDPTKAPKVSMRSVWAEAKASQKAVLETRAGEEWRRTTRSSGKRPCARKGKVTSKVLSLPRRLLAWLVPCGLPPAGSPSGRGKS